MNYNEYDSNGNKKKIDIISLFSDKTNRSRIILLFYIILFVILVIIIRNTSGNEYKDNNENKVDNSSENAEKIDVVENNEDEENEFSYLFLNNYNFDFLISIDDDNYQIIGKRFNDKYEFEFIDEEKVNYIGTYDDLYRKGEDEEKYTRTSLPIPVLDIFDNDLLKEIVDSSIKQEDYYVISNDDLNNIVLSPQYSIDYPEKTNIIKLDIKNNKVVGIDIDFSNIANEWDEEVTIAKVKLNYSNFGLVDDFSVNIE